MAKFQCPKCKKIQNKDLRYFYNKENLTKSGKFHSYCGQYKKDVLMVRLEK